MLNTSDILETIRMIQDECLDIRTITMGISLLDCCSEDMDALCTRVYDKITRKAEKLVAAGQQIETEYGIPIINKRISITPAAMLVGATRGGDPVKLAYALQRAAEAGLLRRRHARAAHHGIAPPAGGDFRRENVASGLQKRSHIVGKRMAALDDVREAGLETILRADFLSVQVGTEHAQSRNRPGGAADGFRIRTRKRLDESRRVAHAVRTERHIRVYGNKGSQQDSCHCMYYLRDMMNPAIRTRVNSFAVRTLRSKRASSTCPGTVARPNPPPIVNPPVPLCASGFGQSS